MTSKKQLTFETDNVIVITNDLKNSDDVEVCSSVDTDIVFSVAKLFFAYGLGNAMTFPMSVGATTILLPTRPVPEKVSEILKKYKITILFAVPTIFSSLLEFFNDNWGEEYINLRVSVSAGEALPKNLGEQWRSLTSTEILDGIGNIDLKEYMMELANHLVIQDWGWL